MNKIDMHFHTRLSDWAKNNSEIIKQAKDEWVDFIIATEHDIINKDFTIESRMNWVNSTFWAEISALDDIITNKSLHLTCYSNKFNKDIEDILENTRNWRIDKVKKQITILEKNWFNIDYENFINYYKNKWFNIKNLSNSQVEDYIFKYEENLKLIKKLTWENIWKWDFIKRCLWRNWDLNYIWWWKVDNYEPSIKQIWEEVNKNNYFLSLAHPNFSFLNNEDSFYKFIEEYKDILNWIEINSLASKKWVDIIIETSKKYNFILTFWSDDHFSWRKDDNKHWQFWQLNPYLSKELINENFMDFLDVLEN